MKTNHISILVTFILFLFIWVPTPVSNQIVNKVTIDHQEELRIIDSIRTDVKSKFKRIDKIDSIEFNHLVNHIVGYMIDETKLTKETFAQALIDLEIRYPDIAYNSSITEGFNSKLATTGNNLFGMRIPGQRATCTLNKKVLGHASYPNWIYSVADYKLFQLDKKPKSIQNRESWIKFLNRGYNASRTYGTRISKMRIPDNIKEILM